MNLTDKQRQGKRFIKRGIRAGVNDPRNVRLEMMCLALEELHRQYSVKPRKRVAA